MTLTVYYYFPEFIGGEADGQEVDEKHWKSKVVVKDDERYFLRRHVFGPAAIGCFVHEFWPKHIFWPYEATRRILASHPKLKPLKDPDSV